MLLHWSKKLGRCIPTCTSEEEEDDDAVVDCNYIRNTVPITPLLPRVSRTGRDTSTSRLSATLTSLSPTFQVRPLCQRGTNGLQNRSLCMPKTEPNLGPGLATPHRRKTLRQAHGRLLLSLCQTTSVYCHKGKSTLRGDCVLETVKEGEQGSPNFTILSGSRIKNLLKYKLCSQPIWTQHCPQYHVSC